MPKVKNLLMECSLLFYFVGFDSTVIMLLYMSGYTLSEKNKVQLQTLKRQNVAIHGH